MSPGWAPFPMALAGKRPQVVKNVGEARQLGRGDQIRNRRNRIGTDNELIIYLLSDTPPARRVIVQVADDGVDALPCSD